MLFSAWGRDYDPAQSPVACDFALETGLACLDRQGSRRSIEFLNRPVMLFLQGDEGRKGYVVIRRLQGDEAEIMAVDGPLSVSFNDIEPYWFGEYRILWQQPEYRTNDQFNQTGNGESLWIGARMMELADRLNPSEADAGRVKRLPAEEQVRWYQSRKGLVVDGIAGAMTLIQINNDLDATVPRLLSTPGSEG
eukprot:TRINITY_DN544_c0_g1_i1.p2 TRINITY_DN544_c0_g1~~TRINITY_DN544_c0_g1_i1.p2  ORF type:complete len:193 (-),score=13.01 TRINITY_DN544_c0_g1_i1:677-1255(-)